MRKQNKSRTRIKYKNCDKVRISKYKRHFEKGYTPNWTEEIFTIDKINKTNPVIYQIRDVNNEKILGSFYTREFSSAKQNIYYPKVLTGHLVLIIFLKRHKQSHNYAYPDRPICQ